MCLPGKNQPFLQKKNTGQTEEIEKEWDEEEDDLSCLREMKICSTTEQPYFFFASNKHVACPCACMTHPGMPQTNPPRRL